MLLRSVDFMTTDLNSREDLRVQILVMSCRHFKEPGCSSGSKLQSLAQVHALE